MIKKIVSVKNVGKFISYSAQGDMELRKLTVIYAENGRGKTTLCAILRSLQRGESDHVLGRRTLGSDGSPLIQILSDTGMLAFEGGKWTSRFPLMEIFDSTFVNENVFSGGCVDQGHKRSLYQFAIGEPGVELAKRVEHLAEDIRDVGATIKEKGSEIQQLVGRTVALPYFLALRPVDAVEARIQAKQNEIASLAIAEEIGTMQPLSELALPEVPLEQLRQVLARRLDSISSEAEARARSHIATLRGERGEAWLREGVEHTVGDNCPFCGAPLCGNELYDAYLLYFDQAYSVFKEHIAKTEHDMMQLLSEDALSAVQQLVLGNETLAAFWRQHVDIKSPQMPFDGLRERWLSLRCLLQDHLHRKLTSPLEVVELSDELVEAVNRYQELLHEVESYNAEIARFNNSVRAVKEATQRGNLEQARTELQTLIDTQARYQSDVEAACTEYERLVQRREALEAEKKQAKSDLDQYTESLLAAYQERINEYLAMFGASFRIGGVKTSYPGGKPSSTYSISINSTTVDLGDSKSIAKPCFGNTLSDGDRHTLAFAFFLARLDQDSDIGAKVVVLDDPITSLDAHRRTCTQQRICRVVQSAKQVILLSHDPHFLRLVWDNSSKAEARTLCLRRCANDGTRVDDWDIAKETQSEYFRCYSVLCEYLEDPTKHERRDIARAIRPVLEGNLRVRFPQEFAPSMWLGDFIGKVRAATPGSALHPMQSRLQDLVDVNDYSKRYHHGLNPFAEQEEVRDAELQTYIRKTLDLLAG